ncbi:MAG: radical SAM protein [Pirellulaceae bacterium]|nr:radical SAM protein [Pirellulaceae bacterium]
MVTLLGWLQRDWQSFVHSTRADLRIQPGMYTYRLKPAGGERRVHLRIEADGSGVMFVDVTDVVHLNQTAAELAKWALDGVPQTQAELRWKIRSGRGLRRRQSAKGIAQDIHEIYSMIARLADAGGGCTTCAVGTEHRQPLFSTPIHAPYKADLAITYKCNNDCPHCYNEADRLTLQSMPVEDWMRVVDRLHHVGVPHLIFTGGEATLYPDLPELIAYANQLGPICGLNTNGRRMAQPQYARRLAEAGLNHVQVTLGSHRAEVHDRMMNARSFEQTVQGIRNAQEAGLHTITNTTLMQMNSGEIVQTIEFLHALGIRTFAVNGMIYSGGGFDTGQAIREELMPPLLIRIRDRAAELGMKFLWYTPTMYCRLSPVELEIGAKRCNAGEYSLCVEPNADVLPCQSFYVAAGNLLRDPWESIWHSPLFHSFRDRELDPQAAGLPEMCWKCPDLQLCGGGCRIEREAAAGLRTSGGGCSSGGCSSGGCKSSGCSSGAKSTSQLPLVSVSVADAVQPSPSPSGFVSVKSVQVASAGGKRRGTGAFAE